MSDMSVSRDNQRQQIDDFKQEQEQKLQSLRADYRRKEMAIKESGDAAVNHIKKSTEEKVENTRVDSQAQLRHESDQLNKNYSDLRRRNAQQIQTLDRQAEEAQERSSHNIAQAESSENRAIRRSQEDLKDFLAKQQEFRQKTQESLNKDVRDETERATHKLAQEKQHNNAEISDLESKHKQDVQDFKERSSKTLTEAREQANHRLQELRTKNEQDYDKERRQGNLTIAETRSRAGDAVKSEQIQNQRQLEALNKENNEQLQQNKEHALKTNEKMLKAYSYETQRIETQGEATINQKQEKFDKLLKEQDSYNKARIKDQQTDYAAQELRARSEYEAKTQEDAKRIDQALNEQKSDFVRKYETNDKSFKDSLDNQKEGYLKALYKQKQRFDSKMSVEESRAHDPFYSVKTFDGKLEERSGGYFLSAKVAPYDRDTVEVKVKDDKITLTARRSYENSFTEGKERVQTNSFQTYKQEFKLDIPVQNDKAVTRIADDGSISVFVPKKGYSAKA